MGESNLYKDWAISIAVPAYMVEQLKLLSKETGLPIRWLACTMLYKYMKQNSYVDVDDANELLEACGIDKRLEPIRDDEGKITRCNLKSINTKKKDDDEIAVYVSPKNAERKFDI